MHIFLTFLALLFSFPIFSAEDDAFESSAQVTVLDKNFSKAKIKVLEQLELNLIEEGAKQIVTEKIFEDYKLVILPHLGKNSSVFIRSLKVLEQKSEGKTFSMKVKGKLNLTELKKSLKKINIPLKSSPTIQASIATSFQDQELIEQVKKKLNLFKIQINNSFSFKKNENEEILELERIKDLYAGIQENILFVISDTAIENHHYLQTEVFRKTDLKTIGAFRIKLNLEDGQPVLDEDLRKNFLDRINLNFINLNDFYKNQLNYFKIKVLGNTMPRARKDIEINLFKNCPLVESFFLSKLANQEVEYLVEINANSQKFSQFVQENTGNYLILKDQADSFISLLSIIPNELRTIAAEKWQEKASVIEKLQSYFEDINEFETWIPVFQENETSDQSLVNRVDENLAFTGTLYNRSDEDLFSIRLSEQESISFYWVKLNKSRLTPIVKIYDSELNLLFQYRVLSNQIKQKFTYQFPIKYSGNLIIKIADQFGFIPGEIGGFQTYPYIAKVSADSQEVVSE